MQPTMKTCLLLTKSENLWASWSKTFFSCKSSPATSLWGVLSSNILAGRYVIYNELCKQIVLCKIILETSKDSLANRLQDEQAGFCKERSTVTILPH